MGGFVKMFTGGGGSSKPTIIPMPTEPARSDADVQEEAQAEKRRLLAAKDRDDLIVTGPAGILGPAPTKRASLSAPSGQVA